MGEALLVHLFAVVYLHILLLLPANQLMMLLQSSLSDELILLTCSGFGHHFSVSAPLSVTCKHYHQLLKSQPALYFPESEELQLVTPCLSELIGFDNAPDSLALHTCGERIGILLSALSRPQHAVAGISG